ncbi:TRAP transporter small permease [Halomonas sp. TD01]|uniref:TRAP transporter small permease n=1 Tax=Halomonas sp. TD01 TaxID=999141 RepID=UPI000214F5BF|nr:TRAP transporter small permease [Halomonas sp. TD01]EGP18913.1 tripartite ATP-independent periplasmic transporter DctQ [Halomonas sp. TD01]CAH1042238.1 TRAP-type transport system, small permease component, predicted N-acetylneuraminate transporter [Halomonas sp. TD01]
MLKQISHGLARLEVAVAALLAAAVTGLILLNIVTRALGSPLYWVDELAIHAMVWMTFLTTSVVLKRREGIAVTLFTDSLPPRFQVFSRFMVDALVLFFAGLMLWLCWCWYDPLTLWAVGFDVSAFQAESFNFIYSERTSTLGLPKYLSWLCLPIFSVSLGLHGLVNVVDSLKGLLTGNRRLA